MRKIVLLQGIDTTRRVFTPLQLEILQSFGEVVVNPRGGRASVEEAKALIDGAEIVVTSWGCPAINDEILRHAPDLKLIVHAAGTVKGIVTQDVIDRGIRVSSANGALGKGVAETALGLTIVSLKHIWALARDTREGEWSKNKHLVKELYGVNIGVIGAGKAGRHYIELLRHFEVNIFVYDPIASDEEIRQLGAVRVGLEELLRESDLVSIHAPSIPETYRMLNAERLGLMKDGAILINTARGSIIDEDALVSELQKGRLWACLDVTDPEPPTADHPFRTLPNVTLIPHIAGAVNNGLHRMGNHTVREIQAYMEGKPLKGEVNLSNLHALA